MNFTVGDLIFDVGNRISDFSTIYWQLDVSSSCSFHANNEGNEMEYLVKRTVNLMTLVLQNFLTLRF